MAVWLGIAHINIDVAIALGSLASPGLTSAGLQIGARSLSLGYLNRCIQPALATGCRRFLALLPIALLALTIGNFYSVYGSCRGFRFSFQLRFRQSVDDGGFRCSFVWEEAKFLQDEMVGTRATIVIAPIRP
jgi:hypothetical protein